MTYKDTNSGIQFTSVKLPQTLFNEGPLGIKYSENGNNSEGQKGIKYNGNGIESVVPFINAVDIDWNGANVGENIELNTTGDLLNWIEGTSNNLAQKDTQLEQRISNLENQDEEDQEINLDEISGTTLSYENGEINNLTSNNILTENIKVSGTAEINNSSIRNLQSENITTDYLTVNKSANFFEITVDKIKSVQGIQINSAANCVIDYVEAYDSEDTLTTIGSNNISYYRVYWKNEDTSNTIISNTWQPLDQAICASFNINNSESISTNKYYWRKVIRTDSGNKKQICFDRKIVNNESEKSNSEMSRTINQLQYVIPTSYELFSDFNILAEENSTWNNNEITIYSPKGGLILVPNQELISGGIFSFNLSDDAKCSIYIYYNDNSVKTYTSEYSNQYVIQTDFNKNISKIKILFDVLDKWEYCNWIDLSFSDLGAIIPSKSPVPEVGDNLCQLGYRYNELPGYQNTAEWRNSHKSEIARASAIIISSYDTPDTELFPPSYAHYQDIINYNLSSFRKSYFDATGAHFMGEFLIQAGNQTRTLDQYIQDQTTIMPAQIIVGNGNSEIVSCIMQVDSFNQIHDINNFPGWTDGQGKRHISVSIYTEESYTPLSIYCDLFGRTVTILDIDPDSGNIRLLPTPDEAYGIYIDNVTYGSDSLNIVFDFRGDNQTIQNGSLIDFYGTVTINETNYSIRKSLQVNTITSAMEGLDGELWQLHKEIEYAVVGSDGNFACKFRYQIHRTVGSTTEVIIPSDQSLKIRGWNIAQGEIQDLITTMTASDYNPTYHWEYNFPSEASYNWYNQPSRLRPIYYTIELLDGNQNILATSLITVVNEPTALFTVKEGLMQSIQANTTLINDEANTRQTQYSAITQEVDRINSTVASQTYNINTLESTISEINQAADGINLEVINMYNFANGSFPINNEYQQYVYYCTDSSTSPTKPSGDITTNTEVYNQWTLYNIEATETYKYVWYSVRTKEINLPQEGLSSDSEDWGDWSNSILLQTFGSPRGYVNNAALKITADGITSSVTSTLGQSISTIDQKADSISLHVDTLESNLQTTGIDIEHGQITLNAENTDIQGNLNIGGNFESYNAQYMNRTIINTNSSHNQGLVMRGPDSIDTQTGLPNIDAEEIDLVRLDFTATAGQRSGQLTLYDRGNQNNYMQIDSREILLNNSNGTVNFSPGGVTYSYQGDAYDRTWEELFCNKLRTNYINTGTGYTVVDSDMITDIFVIDSGDKDGNFGLFLPYPGPEWDGKRFYIKKIDSGNLRLVTTDRDSNEANYLLDGNDSGPQSSHWYDRYSVTVICAGNYWIVFRGDD